MSHFGFGFNLVQPQQTMSHNYGSYPSVPQNFQQQQQQQMHPQHLQQQHQQISTPPSQPKSLSILSMLNPAPSPPHRSSQQPSNNSSTPLLPPPSIAAQQYYASVAGEVISQYPSMRISHSQARTALQPSPPAYPQSYVYQNPSASSYSKSLCNSSSSNSNNNYHRNVSFQTTSPVNYNSPSTLTTASQISSSITTPHSIPPGSTCHNHHVPSSLPSSPLVSQNKPSSPPLNCYSQSPPTLPESSLCNHVNDSVNSIANLIDMNSLHLEENTIISKPEPHNQHVQDLPYASQVQSMVSNGIVGASALDQLVQAALEQETQDEKLREELREEISEEVGYQQQFQDIDLSSSSPQEDEDEASVQLVNPDPLLSLPQGAYNNNRTTNITSEAPYHLTAASSPAQSNTSLDGVYEEYEEPLKEEETSESAYESEAQAISNEFSDKSIRSLPEAQELSLKGEMSKEESNSSSVESQPQKIQQKSKQAILKKVVKKSLARNTLTSKKGVKRRSSAASMAGSGEDRVLRLDSSQRNNKKQRRQSTHLGAHASKVISPYLKSTAIASTAEQMVLEDSAQPDNKLYCICQTLYDGLRFMICCDNCGEWYHGDCVNVKEEESQLIDKYYCKSCTAKGFKSLWMQRCKNSECYKPARAPESKYCSRDCGLDWARKKLRESEEKRAKLLIYLEGNKEGDKKKPLKKNVNDNNNNNSQAKQFTRNLAADLDDCAHLQQIQENREKIKKSLQANERREKLLKRIILRWKNKSQEFEKEKEAPCGFDQRLVWGDKIIKDEDFQEDTSNMCKTPKGNCEKHRDWQRIKSLEVEQERTLQTNLLEKLRAEEKQIKIRMKRRRTDLAAALLNGTIDHTASNISDIKGGQNLDGLTKMDVDIES